MVTQGNEAKAKKTDSPTMLMAPPKNAHLLTYYSPLP